MSDRGGFDVVVVGASIAGCTAARLFARAGARVALVERRPDPAAYKVTCTHAIVSSAVPTIERLGLAPLLEARGAVLARPEAWTPYGGRVRPHNRFFYFAYWRGIRPRSTSARLWLLDPHGAAAFPNEDDVTVVVVAPHRSRLPEFRSDPEGAYRRMVGGLRDGSHALEAERVSKLIGKLDVPNVMRPAARPGVAFVGDAALATDPFFGVGCGWAFQSAEWLVDRTHEALLDGGELDRALDRYRQAFWRRLALDHWLISDMSTRRNLRLGERLMFRAATRDPAVAQALEETLARRRSSARLFDPRLTVRVLSALAR